jgi:hypothetical protein
MRKHGSKSKNQIKPNFTRITKHNDKVLAQYRLGGSTYITPKEFETFEEADEFLNSFKNANR